MIVSSPPTMHGLRSSCKGRIGLAIVFGLLLAFGPGIRSIAAAEGSCDQPTGSSNAGSVIERSAVQPSLSCPDRASPSTIRALPSERPEGGSHDVHATRADGHVFWASPVQKRMSETITEPFISPDLRDLRSVVLLI